MSTVNKRRSNIEHLTKVNFKKELENRKQYLLNLITQLNSSKNIPKEYQGVLENGDLDIFKEQLHRMYDVYINEDNLKEMEKEYSKIYEEFTSKELEYLVSQDILCEKLDKAAILWEELHKDFMDSTVKKFEE